jgi:sec-independent protein translocase protein TatC
LLKKRSTAKKKSSVSKKKPVSIVEVEKTDLIIESENEIVETSSREKYMSLGDHLEELRQRLIKCIFILFAFTLFFMIFGPEVHKIFSAPYKTVLGKDATFFQIKLMAPIMIYLKTSFLLSVLLSVPFLLYLVWGFVSPAVEDKTEKYGKFLIIFATLLFWAGIALCWFTVFENFLRIFLVIFRTPDIETKLPIDEYYDIFFNLHLIFGLSFELPIVLIILGRIGILSSDFLIAKWRETTLILSVASAILSPGPDVFSMMMLFVPLLILFFVSIFIMRFMEKSNSN